MSNALHFHLIMVQVISVVQIILAVILICLILLQAKGTGLGSTFGGELGFYGTKRGAEKMLFILTIIIASSFLVSLLVGVAL